jgi:hypothetical protein
LAGLAVASVVGGPSDAALGRVASRRIGTDTSSTRWRWNGLDKQKLLARLMKLQEDLRNRMIGDLDAEGDELDEIFSPESFSNKYEVYRYKYTERLDTLNRIIGEVQRAEGTRPTFKITSVEAAGRDDLVPLINQRLAKMRPATVADVKILRDTTSNTWIAMILCGF